MLRKEMAICVKLGKKKKKEKNKPDTRKKMPFCRQESSPLQMFFIPVVLICKFIFRLN